MSVTLKDSPNATFARHETFTPRYAWLKRGFDLIAAADHDGEPDRYAFNADRVHHELGVGKNMARSIRFWLQAARLLEERKPAGERSHVGEPTVFGTALLDDRHGLDPYLEDVGTWWLLHWMLVSPQTYLPVWWAAFHTFTAVRFKPDDLVAHAAACWPDQRESSITKDVKALVRAYRGKTGSRRRDKIDDILDSPLAQLGLVAATQQTRSLRFARGPKPGLPPAVAAFACLDFLQRTEAAGRQQLIATLATEQGGPGRAFKLPERALVGLLERAAAESDGLIQVSTTAGSEMLTIPGQASFGTVAARLLHRHYQRLGSPAPEPTGPYHVHPARAVASATS